jgi:hypothetical protein
MEGEMVIKTSEEWRSLALATGIKGLQNGFILARWASRFEKTTVVRLDGSRIVYDGGKCILREPRKLRK